MTARHLLGLSTGLLLSLAAVQGATILGGTNDPCAMTGTYQDLMNTNATGGCTIDIGGGASLTFSDFTFTPAGAGTPTAAQVGYTLDDPAIGLGGEPVFGFDFNLGLAAIGDSIPVQDMLLTYKIVPVGTSIISDDLLENANATGTGVGQVSEDLMFCIASDPNNTSGVCRTFGGTPIVVSTATPPTQREVTFGPWTSATVSKDIEAVSGGAAGSAFISQVQNAVDLTVVPEPTTYSLVSIGLLAIAYFSRRRTA